MQVRIDQAQRHQRENDGDKAMAYSRVRDA
jgi:hypothetical protein